MAVGQSKEERQSQSLLRTKGGEENMDAFRQREMQIAKAAADVVNTLERVGRLLMVIDDVLRVSQPLSVPGNLGVRWWFTNGQDWIRRPKLVQWTRLRSGNWRARRVAQVRRDRINRVGTAAINAEQTYHLALQASRLIKVYEDLAKQLCGPILVLHRAHVKASSTLPYATLLITAAHREVVGNLVAAGYPVDGDTVTLIERANL